MLAINLSRIKALFSTNEPTPPGDTCRYTCNVCGSVNVCAMSSIERESGACHSCGATLRFRSLVAALTLRMVGSVVVLRDIEKRKDVVGVGMSDAPCYARLLEQKFSFTNTFYHCEPRLDMTNPSEQRLHSCDFIISSDVYEHVALPV